MSKSFVEIPAGSDFSYRNLPYGIIRSAGQGPRVGVAIGDLVLDLAVLEEAGLLKVEGGPVFNQPTLNAFARTGKKSWSAVRARIRELLSADHATLRDNAELRKRALHPRAAVELLLPFTIGGYTDFYASMTHAMNVGKIYRGEENALLPNWKHIPIAYNGRASSVVVSGTPIARPHGQLKGPNDAVPKFGPTGKLDIEVELGFFIGKDSELGRPIPIDQAEDYIFGLVLVNDWSARDIQGWEYVPLGPFLGKSFGTTVSPWVVPYEALREARFTLPAQEPAPLPYLAGPQKGFDIDITAELRAKGGTTTICRTNTKHLYWSLEQMLTHHASNGCNMRVGDLLASGTISGPDNENFGSLLERSINGKQPIPVAGAETRSFLHDGDEVILTAAVTLGGERIGFGEAAGKVLSTFL